MSTTTELPLTTAVSPSALRRKLQTVLGKNACYTKLNPDSKVPSGSFKKGRRNRYIRIPLEENYGVIPQNRLFILDLDDHHADSWTVDEQMDFFSDFFGLNLRKSLAVVTQSGGVHVYLYFPPNVDAELIQNSIPKGSLRTYNDAFSQYTGKTVNLDADIRSGHSNGYVVGPTSSIDFPEKKKFKSYILSNESFGFDNPTYEILSISEESLSKLKEVVELKRSQNRRRPKTVVVTDMASGIQHDLDEIDYEVDHYFGTEINPEWLVDTKEKGKLIHAKPSNEIINLLRMQLSKKKVTAFHQARAVVKSSLHCCYDDYSIAMACVELGVDKDSYRKESLGFRHLVGDIGRFKPEKRYHSVYCYEGRKRIRDLPKKKKANDGDFKEFNVESYREFNKKKLEEKRSRALNSTPKFVNPRVLDVSKISKSLLGDSRKRKPSQQYSDAMDIINYYVQPLTNVGVIRVLLAHANIAESLNINSSRVSQAMRVLRNSGVIRVEQRQRTGMAATYSVSEEYDHVFLTKALRLAWGKFNSEESYDQPHPIYFNFVKGEFRTVFSDEIVTPVSSFKSWVRTMRQNIPKELKLEDHGAGASSRYLVAEKEAFANHEEEDEAYDPLLTETAEGVINTETGEIVEGTSTKSAESLDELEEKVDFDKLFNLLDEEDAESDSVFDEELQKLANIKDSNLTSAKHYSSENCSVGKESIENLEIGEIVDDLIIESPPN